MNGVNSYVLCNVDNGLCTFLRWGLKRDAAAFAVFDKDAAVDETFVEVALVVARVDDVAGAGGLAEDADLVLALAGVVVGQGVGHAAEGFGASAVVYTEGAVIFHVSLNHFTPFFFLFFLFLPCHDNRDRACGNKVNKLSDKVQRDGKVLPLVPQDRRAPDLPVLPVEHLPRVPRQTVLPEYGAGLKVKLVRAVVGRLVPHVEVLVAQVQGPLGVPLEGEVDRLDARRAGGVSVGVPLELQAGAAEAPLVVEDGRVVDGDLEGLLVGRVVEPGRGGDVGELEDGRPGEAGAFDVVGVEGGGVPVVKVEGFEGGVGPAVEDDGAEGFGCGGLGTGTAGAADGAGEGGAGQEAEEEGGVHFGWLIQGVKDGGNQVTSPEIRKCKMDGGENGLYIHIIHLRDDQPRSHPCLGMRPFSFCLPSCG